MQPSYYTKKLYKFIHTVITNGFQMIIVTFKVHPFDKYRKEWYSMVVIICQNPYFFRINEYKCLYKGERT